MLLILALQNRFYLKWLGNKVQTIFAVTFINSSVSWVVKSESDISEFILYNFVTPIWTFFIRLGLKVPLVFSWQQGPEYVPIQMLESEFLIFPSFVHH